MCPPFRVIGIEGVRPTVHGITFDPRICKNVLLRAQSIVIKLIRHSFDMKTDSQYNFP